jgi:hypothetical protein
MGRRIAALLGVVACLGASAASAAADTATFGSKLQGSHNLSIVTSNGAMNLATTTGARLDAPANGVIKSWAVRSGDLNSLYALAVLRPRSGGGWYVASTVAANSVVQDSGDVVHTYTASPPIPIQAGDFIGLDNANPSLPLHQSGNSGDVLGRFTGPFFTGANLGDPTSDPGRELLVQATETYCPNPSVQGQKLAAARQLLSSHDCTVSVKKKKVKKKRKKSKVLAQAPAAGTAVAPDTPILLTVGKLKKPKK